MLLYVTKRSGVYLHDITLKHIQYYIMKLTNGKVHFSSFQKEAIGNNYSNTFSRSDVSRNRTKVKREL